MQTAKLLKLGFGCWVSQDGKGREGARIPGGWVLAAGEGPDGELGTGRRAAAAAQLPHESARAAPGWTGEEKAGVKSGRAVLVYCYAMVY